VTWGADNGRQRNAKCTNRDKRCELSSTSVIRARVEGAGNTREFGEAKREQSYIDSGAGRHKLLYESKGQKGRAGVRNVLPATDPRGIIGRRSPING
jgi:hypothetical protein